MLLFLITFVIIINIIYNYNQFKYWDKKGVPNIKPFTPAGNLLKCLLCIKNLGALLQEYYNEFKQKNHKFGGIYFTLGPIFMPIDFNLIKRILITDFDYFGSRTVYDKYFQFYENIYNFDYKNWARLRPKLEGQFSKDNIKVMFNGIQATAKDLLKTIEANRKESINVTHLTQYYALNALQECLTGKKDEVQNQNSDSGRVLPHLFTLSCRNWFLMFFKDGIRNPGNIMKALITSRDVMKYFTKVAVHEAKQYKAKGSHKNAFLNNLIATVSNKAHGTVNYLEVAANLCVFYVMGLNAISINLAMCLYTLGNDHYLQDNVRNEIAYELTQNNNKLKYKYFANMKLLEGVILECFRMYPVDIAIQRTCVKNYKIPESDVTLNKGTRILISLAGLNFDEDLYTNPNTFDPYRYMNERTRPFYLYFGAGPRQCIGTELGLIIIKTALALILKQYKVTVNIAKTGKKIKTENVTRHFMFQYKNNVWIDFETI